MLRQVMEIVKQSQFVKAGVNIKNGDIVQLLTEGEWKEITAFGTKRKVLQFDMKLVNKEIKTYTMNNSTIDNLTLAYGSDSAKWSNINLKAHTVDQMIRGKMTKVLVLTPADWKEATKEEIPVIAE